MRSELDAFEGFCRDALTTEEGLPLVLYPEQREMLADYFSGTRETLILLPKKNGKSTISSALALFHLCTTGEAEAIIAAASRDQASIILRQAQGFVRRSEPLQARIQVKQRELVHRTLHGRVRVLAADVHTGDGQIPTLALVDELHRHKTPELYGILRDGLGARDGQMLTISTAGSDQNSVLWRMRQGAIDAGVKVQGSYTRGGGKSFVLHEWSVPPDADLNDIALVKTANPAPWITVDALRERHSSPSTTPWQWARFACNVWTQGEEAWLPIGTWDSSVEPGVTIPAGADVWAGVDLGLKHDSAAIVYVWKRGEGDLVAAAEVLDPPTDGTALDIGTVEAAVRRGARRYNLKAVGYDPWRFERSAQLLGNEGLLMVEHPMSNERMCPESEQLREMIVAAQIHHDGDPIFAAHVNAGVPTETDRGWRLTKRKARDKIDALIALLVAVRMIGVGPEPSREVKCSDRRIERGLKPGEGRGTWVAGTWETAERYVDAEDRGRNWDTDSARG